MKSTNKRLEFLKIGLLAAACLVVAGNTQFFPGQDDKNDIQKAPTKKTGGDGEDGYPKTHPGRGGPLGSDTDRGKLVSGFREPALPPLPVVTPDVPDLPYKMVDGFKEFHLTAEPVKRELLPDHEMIHWGYNGSLPGPTIQVVEGDKVRIVVHNNLPEPTTLHLHGLELLNSMDGVPHVTQKPIMPGKSAVYEVKLHQTGTYFYHPHDAMQETIGMVGLFIIHPKENFRPAVDHDFAIIAQEFAIAPAINIPNTVSMDFNWFTFNGKSGPYGTPMVVKLGSRVRIRVVNFSTIDHHPIHIHGHTFWVTGTEGGRIPPSAWIPGNTVLVGVAQVREFEFVANNPGDWVIHCHMFHHMMNHMVSAVGPGSRKKADGKLFDPRYKVPGYPQMMGMMEPLSQSQISKIQSRKEVQGMHKEWFKGVKGLFSVVRVLPPELYEQVMSGKKQIPVGVSVPGPDPTSPEMLKKNKMK